MHLKSFGLGNINCIKGTVPFLHTFGDKVGHCEVDSSELKSLKADYFVMCNNAYACQIFRYVRHYIPLLKISTALLSSSLGYSENQMQLLSMFVSKHSYLLPDNMPLLGKSQKFNNLILNMANQSPDLISYLTNAEMIRDQLLIDMNLVTEEEKLILEKKIG